MHSFLERGYLNATANSNLPKRDSGISWKITPHWSQSNPRLSQVSEDPFHFTNSVFSYNTVLLLHVVQTPQQKGQKDSTSEGYLGSSPDPELFRSKPFTWHCFRHFRLQWKKKKKIKTSFLTYL